MGEAEKLARPGAGGHGGFAFFPADERQRLRMRRFLIASGTSLLVCLVLFVCSYFGVLPLQAAVRGTVGIVALIVLFTTSFGARWVWTIIQTALILGSVFFAAGFVGEQIAGLRAELRDMRRRVDEGLPPDSSK